MESIKTFKVSSNLEKFKVNFRNDYPNGPTAMTFNENGELFISDPLNERVIKLDEHLEYSSEYKNLQTANVVAPYYAKRDYLYSFHDGEILIDYIQGDRIIKITVDLQKSIYSNLYSSGDFVIFNDIFLTRLTNGKIIGILHPGNNINTNNQNILSEEKIGSILEILKLKNLQVDDKNRIFIDGLLQTNNYTTFYNYLDEKIGNRINSKMRLNWDISKLNNNEMIYLGTDKDRNVYWHGGFKWIYVFNQEGILLCLFSYDFSNTKIVPALHPSGDVYFLNYDSDTIQISKINRRW
jgi:hypothetical protein